ncbi:TA system VapC family ribonuclease toxin [Nocardioides sp.]|uniref:TA system VapC family ribonuclease toxin n=1 Tax=Nocardioides sp. TaxID=35761 RepID=UPI0039E64941
MNVLDVNVLIALAHQGHPYYMSAKTWWDASLEHGEPFTVPDVVETGFVRIATNLRADRPLELSEAYDFLNGLHETETFVRWVTSPRTDVIFRRIASESNIRGKRISDAWIAALAAAYGGTVVTFDRDFRVFAGVKVNELPL